MKKLFVTALVGMTLTVAISPAFAKVKVVKKGKHEVFFMDQTGQKLDPADATIKALQGGQVFKCQGLSATVNSDSGAISTKAAAKESE